MSFSRDLPDPGIKPVSLALQADSLLSEPAGKPNLVKGTQSTKSRFFLLPDSPLGQSPS